MIDDISKWKLEKMRVIPKHHNIDNNCALLIKLVTCKHHSHIWYQQITRKDLKGKIY